MSQALHHQSDGEIVTVYFDEEHISDEQLILQMERDLLALLDQLGERKVVLGLSRVKFMGTSGLGLLLRARTRCKQHGIRLKLCHLSTEIREVFSVTRLDTIFDICEDAQSARDSFHDDE